MEIRWCDYAPDEWERLRIQDICSKVTSGGTPSRNVPEYYVGGTIDWVKTKELADGWLYSTEEKINERATQKSSARTLPASTVLMAMYGATVGKLGILTKPMACNQACCAMIVDSSKADYRFLFYQLLYARPQLLSLATGAAQQNLSVEVIKKIILPMPQVDEQRAIAHILGTLDDKIELNHRMNETLEAIARAIFKSWFIDFDPVRAKAEGKQPFGMDEETAALFPSEFEDSELGEIPKGWKIGTVAEEYRLTMGQSPPGSTYNEEGEGILFFQGRTDFGFRYPKPRVYCIAPTRLAEAGDTLVSVRAPVGDVNMARTRCCVGRGLAALRHKSGSRSYTFYSMKALHRVFSLFESQGTVFGCINKKGFSSLKIIIPPDDLVAKFESIAFPLDQAIENNDDQSLTLTHIRDALLPKLLSGEIRVPVEAN